ncbi:MAG: hypothetical protein ACK5RV_01760 [Flavobacterium sp.]|jgi:hypothetical protein|uniref:hypothetical protein n=1 Tax=Flavobacterium sp. TaxID=239 RepID=UPI0022BB6AC1|nr:hypothetical protein [Flavobacterium sp.]MCZ8167857.1 hypothetical protein [Flavobacterium sp.]MCZ8297646.1 hypothetical protein [Flavobacterium sp.]
MKPLFSIVLFCLLLFLAPVSRAQSQHFLLLDEETSEFLPEVNFYLFHQKKKVFEGISPEKEALTLPQIPFDSIAFSKFNFEPKGYARDQLADVIYLKKKIYELEEVVVGSLPEKITLGEHNRILPNSRGMYLQKQLFFGLLLTNEHPFDLALEQVQWYVKKVVHPTKYRILFYKVVVNREIIQRTHISPLQAIPVYISPVQTLDPKQKNKINTPIDYTLTPGEEILVSIELVDYVDANQTVVYPPFEEQTLVKFQCSDETNFYTKYRDAVTEKETEELYNANLWINYDFAFYFYKKPSKSAIRTPAVNLIGQKL